MNDGDSIISDVALNNNFFEGTLLVKENERIISLSPLHVDRFYSYLEDDTVEFRSIESTFLEFRGQKKSFIKVVQEGEPYSLYSKHIPDKKTTGYILPVGGGWFAYGIIRYLRDEEIYFLEMDGVAHQISKPMNNKGYEELIKTEKSIFQMLMGEDYPSIKKEIKSRKLHLGLKADLNQIIEIANSVTQ